MSVFEDILALRAVLVALGVPDALAGEWADQQTEAVIRLDKLRRAADLLPKRGATVAAELEECHRSTIYRRAQKVARWARKRDTR